MKTTKPELDPQPFDPAEFIRDEDECAIYLSLAAEAGDPEEVAAAEKAVARARKLWC